MRRSRRSCSLAALAAFAAVAGAAWAAPAAHAAPAGHFGAANPAFVTYQQQRASGAAAAGTTLVPLPVNPRPWARSGLRLGPLAQGDASLPTSYDPRDPLQNTNAPFLPAVRDQGSFNDCWALPVWARSSSHWHARPLPPTTAKTTSR